MLCGLAAVAGRRLRCGWAGPRRNVYLVPKSLSPASPSPGTM